MIEVTVRRDGDRLAVLHERTQLGVEIADPVAGVHDEIAIPAANVPHVRLEERIEVLLDEQGHVRPDALHAEPSLGDRQRDHTRSVKKIDAGAGRRQCTDTIEAL